MPYRVSPLRTTWVREAGFGVDGTALAAGDAAFSAAARGTLSVLPTRMWAVLRMWLRVAMTATVLR